ncbi:MAG: potassium channel family protein [Longimicrobiales bacterium]
MNRFVIVGLGNFGSAVAEKLHTKGHEVISIDLDEDAVDRIAPLVDIAAVGDGREVELLRRIGADDADAAVISTGDDIAASILATLAMRDIGIPEVYVKVISHDHSRVLDKLGVTETIFPERESGFRLATRIANRGILNYVSLGSDFGVQEMAVPDNWIGHSLRELALPRTHGISVLAVHDVLQDRMMPIPDPDAPLKESDTLLVAGLDDNLTRAVRVR